MGKSPELIVMLTQNDKTVPDAIEVFENSKDTPAKYWGFKEIGLPVNGMKKLVKLMKDAEKVTCLEVVAYSEDECLEGAKLALDCGFDYLMGTLYFPSILKLTNSGNIKYMPFVGNLHGRPSKLEGTIEGMIAEANNHIEAGVYGIDLLAYRYTDDPERLAKEFVKNVPVPVCMAGSIATFERLDRVREINPWAFTIGGAFFENKFGDKLTFAEQIKKVIEYINK